MAVFVRVLFLVVDGSPESLGLGLFLGFEAFAISMSYRWIKPKASHEIKLDLFRVFEQNYYDEVFQPERRNFDGSITPASVRQIQYGEGQTATTFLPVLYYKLSF